MHVIEMSTVSADSAEEVLTENGLQANDAADQHARRVREGRGRLTVLIDLGENLRAFVEVFPAMEEGSVAVENRILIVFVDELRLDLRLKERRSRHGQEKHTARLNVALAHVVRDEMFDHS